MGTEFVVIKEVSRQAYEIFQTPPYYMPPVTWQGKPKAVCKRKPPVIKKRNNY